MLRWFAILSVLAIGCAAPPMGLGAGALQVPRSGGAVTASAGLGAARGRDMFQLDGGVTGAVTSWFAVETGLVYSQVSQTSGNRTVRAYGAFPYVRPRLAVGPWSAAVALSGFAFGAGEGGVIAGIADAQVGYGTHRWSLYAGGYVLHHEVLDGSLTRARQLRVGGEYVFPTAGGDLGAAIEIYHQVDTLTDQADQVASAVHSRFVGVGLKLRFVSGTWAW